MEPELFQAFAAEFHAEVNRARMDQGAERHAAEQEAQRIEQRLKRIVAAIGDGASGRILQAEITALEARQEELARQPAAPAPPPVLLHPNLPELYSRKVAELRDLLDHEETRAEAFDAIRSLVEVIRLVPENGTLTIELEGDLARMLWLSGAQKQTAAAGDRDGRLVEQVKLVAGTGNHRQFRICVAA